MRAMVVLLSACALAVSLFSSGCSEIRYVAGQQPDVSGLEEDLTLGRSTAEDVRSAIGKPSGEGVVMTPVDGKPRQVWSYYYEVGLVKAGDDGTTDARMQRMFLFVYFDDGRYDGYMWFSSLPR